MEHKNSPNKKTIELFPDDFPFAKAATYGYRSRGWETRREIMRAIQENNWKSGRFARKGRRTYCNRKFLQDALDFGCDISRISTGLSIYPTSTSIYYRVLKNNIWQVDARMAFYLAQYGVFVGAVTPTDLKINGKPYNHIAPIHPQYIDPCNPSMDSYDETTGPLVCQEGWFGGIFPISDRKAWGPVWKHERLIYFVLPLKA
jgi:hypothetical protein